MMMKTSTTESNLGIGGPGEGGVVGDGPKMEGDEKQSYVETRAHLGVANDVRTHDPEAIVISEHSKSPALRCWFGRVRTSPNDEG